MDENDSGQKADKAATENGIRITVIWINILRKIESPPFSSLLIDQVWRIGIWLILNWKTLNSSNRDGFLSFSVHDCTLHIQSNSL